MVVAIVSDGGRFDRNERFFGAEGQAKIAATRIAVVGAGGLGSFVVPEAAYLGIGAMAVIDKDVVTESSLNRLLGAVPDDVMAATPKVEVAARVVHTINPEAKVVSIQAWLDDARARAAIEAGDVVIGCLDDDYARLQLTEIVSRAGRPLIDLASDVVDEGRHYGGRVAFTLPRRRCLSCLGLLDPEEVALGGLTEEQRAARDQIYGVTREVLDRRGASVVTINGVVASLGMTELMVYLTGLREPRVTLTYRADTGAVLFSAKEPTSPCHYCERPSARTDTKDSER